MKFNDIDEGLQKQLQDIVEAKEVFKTAMMKEKEYRESNNFKE
jgi:hypothetical protein